MDMELKKRLDEMASVLEATKEKMSIMHKKLQAAEEATLTLKQDLKKQVAEWDALKVEVSKGQQEAEKLVEVILVHQKKCHELMETNRSSNQAVENLMSQIECFQRGYLIGTATSRKTNGRRKSV